MATRTIENRKDRLATIFVAPFMSCSARLPVYFLLIGMFFASYSAFVQGGIMFALYALGVVAAAVTAWFFKRSLLKGPAQAFILELPTYKLPQLSQIGRQVFFNTKAFLVKAGTIIFCLSIILWAMAYYPRLPESRVDEATASAKSTYATLAAAGTIPVKSDEPVSEEDFTANAVASEQLRHSISGRMGHVLEPLIRPLGYDWKMGTGLVAAFAAREVFVSHLGIIYSAGDDVDDTLELQAAMKADVGSNGKPVWTPLVAVSLLVWFVLAMQCMSTLAIVRRETGGWKWPVAMLLYMNGLAYVACLIIYQVGRVLT
jgi:ferrous iron transport protein B